MKQKLFRYFTGLIMATLFTSQAMENPNDLSEAALKELNKIVCSSFSLPQYEKSDLFVISKEFTGLKENSGPFQDKNDFTLLVLHSLSPRDLLNFGQTCQYLHSMSLSPCFYLNNYCLQEGIPRSMPGEAIVYKAMRSKNGIISLANLYSVSVKELSNWFKKSDLEKVLQQYGALPTIVKGLDQAQIEMLYPMIKITLATNPLDDVTAAIKRLIDTVYAVLPMSSPSLCPSYQRLTALNPLFQAHEIRPWEFDDLMRRMERGEIPYNPQTIEVLAHDLFLVPINIPCMSNYFIRNPKKADTAIQLLQWCSKNSVGLQSGSCLIREAVRLQQQDLAFEICEKVLKLPDNGFPFPQQNKAYAILALEKDARLQDAINEFSQQIQRHWQGNQWDLQLDGSKQYILSIFLRTGLLESFNEQYLDFWNNRQSLEPDDGLIEDLFNYDRPEQGRDVIHRHLMEDNTYLLPLPRIHNVIQFTQRIVKTDRATFLPLLKAKMEAEYPKKDVMDEQAQFLLGLVSYSKEPEDIQYVTSQAASLYQKLESKQEIENKLRLTLATIYLQLGNEELTKSCYDQWVNYLLKKHPILQEYDLIKLNDIGLKLIDLKNLSDMTPSAVISKIWQTEVDKKYRNYMFGYY